MTRLIGIVALLLFFFSISEAKTVRIEGTDDPALEKKILHLLENERFMEFAEELKKNNLKLDVENTTDDEMVLQRISAPESNIDHQIYEAVSSNKLEQTEELLNNNADEPVITDEIEVNGFKIPPLWFNAYEHKYLRGKYLGDGKWAKPKNRAEHNIRLREEVIINWIINQKAKEKKIEITKHNKDLLDKLDKELSTFTDSGNSLAKASIEVTKHALAVSAYLGVMYDTELKVDGTAVQNKYDQMLLDKHPFVTNTAKYKVAFINGIENEADAKKAADNIRNGADFSDIARQLDFSFDADYYNSHWAYLSNYSESVRELIQKTPTGRISGPYKGTYGWNILKVLDRKPVKIRPLKHSLFDRLYLKILSELRANAREKHYRKLRSEADVRINGKKIGLPSDFHYFDHEL